MDYSSILEKKMHFSCVCENKEFIENPTHTEIRGDMYQVVH